MDLHSSVFYSCESLNLVKYQPKPTKTVLVLSTLHKGAACQTEGKKKTESVLCYNENKCGVDMLDSMCRRMSVDEGWLPAMATCCLLQHSGHHLYQRVEIIQKDVHVCHGVSCQQNWQKHQSRNQTANSSICIIVFNNGSFWKESSCQVKYVCKRNRTTTLWDVCQQKTSLWQVYGECIQAVPGVVSDCDVHYWGNMLYCVNWRSRLF